jgi:LDH2 family malate/lactate/ureidoglycolate dehydrogenase
VTDGAATERPAARVAAAALRGFTRDVFVAAGLPRAHAETVADVLVWADLRGVESHGVARIPMYLRLLDAGDLNPAPAITIRTDTLAAVVLDMDRAAGPVAMTMAAAKAIEKARDAGIGFALARATTHTAALGYYTSAIARDGMAAIAFAASVPMMAYHGARVAGVSTSPISIAVPGGDHGPLVLDMAASMISAGGLTQARRTGRAIPPGVALDATGLPTTDPAAAATPRPLGGYKGSGLSLMIECLASLLTSNPIIAGALNAGGGLHKQNGLVLAIDVARFADPALFRAEVERLIAAVKALPREPGVAEILVPGERGDRTLEERRRNGIPLSPPTVQDLGFVADRFGVTMPATEQGG